MGQWHELEKKIEKFSVVKLSNKTINELLENKISLDMKIIKNLTHFKK